MNKVKKLSINPPFVKKSFFHDLKLYYEPNRKTVFISFKVELCEVSRLSQRRQRKDTRKIFKKLTEMPPVKWQSWDSRSQELLTIAAQLTIRLFNLSSFSFIFLTVSCFSSECISFLYFDSSSFHTLTKRLSIISNSFVFCCRRPYLYDACFFYRFFISFWCCYIKSYDFIINFSLL